jgi:PAS domain S-box-containing protein
MDFQALIGEPDARLAEMIDATPSCLKIIDKRGQLLTMNPRGLSLIEADDLESVLGADVYSLVEASHRTKFVEFNRAICEGQTGELEFEIVGLRGARRWMETSAAPYRLTNGDTAHIAITNDITERQRVSHTIDQQRHALELTSRLAGLGEIAAGIAHEINNPLAVISGYAGMLRYQIESDEIDPESFKIKLCAIEDTVMRISTITHSLRAFSSDVPAEARGPHSLTAVIDETLGLCGERCKASGIAVEVCADSGVNVDINFVQISQVFMNLLTNSFSAIEHSAEKWIKIDVSKRGKAILVRFSDSGPRIDRVVAEKLMTPFFTTKTMGQGTGLGLPISLGILRSHGGSLRYDPSCEHTTFLMELPAG